MMHGQARLRDGAVDKLALVTSTLDEEISWIFTQCENFRHLKPVLLPPLTVGQSLLALRRAVQAGDLDAAGHIMTLLEDKEADEDFGGKRGEGEEKDGMDDLAGMRTTSSLDEAGPNDVSAFSSHATQLSTHPRGRRLAKLLTTQAQEEVQIIQREVSIHVNIVKPLRIALGLDAPKAGGGREGEHSENRGGSTEGVVVETTLTLEDALKLAEERIKRVRSTGQCPDDASMHMEARRKLTIDGTSSPASASASASAAASASASSAAGDIDVAQRGRSSSTNSTSTTAPSLRQRGSNTPRQRDILANLALSTEVMELAATAKHLVGIRRAAAVENWVQVETCLRLANLEGGVHQVSSLCKECE